MCDCVSECIFLCCVVKLMPRYIFTSTNIYISTTHNIYTSIFIMFLAAIAAAPYKSYCESVRPSITNESNLDNMRESNLLKGCEQKNHTKRPC